MNNFLIYTEQQSERLKYIFDLILSDLLGINYEITCDKNYFLNSNACKFSYAKQPLNNILSFYAHPILFEQNVRPQNITTVNYQNTKAFFSSEESEFALPFDVFSASFFLVTRYEEYNTTAIDKYCRYKASNSLAYKENFLHLPQINIWAKIIREILHHKFPQLLLKTPEYKCIPTIDIDNAFLFKNKSFYKQAGGLLKDLLHFHCNQAFDRMLVYLNIKKDPNDVYADLLTICRKLQLNPIFFILTGKHGGVDNPISIKRKAFQKLIQQLEKNASIGLHLSFRSNFKQSLAQEELNALTAITTKKICKNRQHFLALSFPTTYRELINIGITDDYSMGYATTTGFRASICTPFYFFDLLNNKQTSLKIHPFCLMDQTFNKYLHLSPEDALSKAQQLIDEIKKANGVFIPLLHNDALSNYAAWHSDKNINWKTMIEEMLKYAQHD